MKELRCPYCDEKLGVLKNEVAIAQGSVRCPFCNKGFGWAIRNDKIVYIW